MKRRKLKFMWTCSDHVHHQHRFKIVAILCGQMQKYREMLRAYLLGILMPEFDEEITVSLFCGDKYEFIGRYRRDLERPHWHYYEEEDGTIHHFRKSKIMCVTSKKIERERENLCC